jgi:hypothetical protein
MEPGVKDRIRADDLELLPTMRCVYKYRKSIFEISVYRMEEK